MNVLFALYRDFASNSANHVDGLARELCALGCDCIAAVPNEPTHAELLGEIPYKTATFEQVLNRAVGFGDGGDIGVAHFWTPREVVRQFRSRLRTTRRFASVVHMEDNEELISRSHLGRRFEDYAKGRKPENFPLHLSHPTLWRQFVEEAEGVTVIIDSLKKMVPENKPAEVIWPSTDERSFYPRPISEELRRELEIPTGHTVLAYHGNVHTANFREVRSLYLAVALLNREGRPTTLLRMGRDHVEMDPSYRRWAAEHSLNLGFVPEREQLAKILSQADVFVQPGLCDEFNEYRFPSKIPDFFALARPVVLPRTNIGRVVRHGEEAFVLDEADGPAIADAVNKVLVDPALRERLASGGRKFFEAHLRWPIAAEKVLGLYRRLLSDRTAPR